MRDDISGGVATFWETAHARQSHMESKLKGCKSALFSLEEGYKTINLSIDTFNAACLSEIQRRKVRASELEQKNTSKKALMRTWAVTRLARIGTKRQKAEQGRLFYVWKAVIVRQKLQEGKKRRDEHISLLVLSCHRKRTLTQAFNSIKWYIHFIKLRQKLLGRILKRKHVQNIKLNGWHQMMSMHWNYRMQSKGIELFRRIIWRQSRMNTIRHSMHAWKLFVAVNKDARGRVHSISNKTYRRLIYGAYQIWKCKVDRINLMLKCLHNLMSRQIRQSLLYGWRKWHLCIQRMQMSEKRRKFILHLFLHKRAKTLLRAWMNIKQERMKIKKINVVCAANRRYKVRNMLHNMFHRWIQHIYRAKNVALGFRLLSHVAQHYRKRTAMRKWCWKYYSKNIRENKLLKIIEKKIFETKLHGMRKWVYVNTQAGIQQYENCMATAQQSHMERVQNLQAQHEVKLREMQAHHRSQILTKEDDLETAKKAFEEQQKISEDKHTAKILDLNKKMEKIERKLGEEGEKYKKLSLSMAVADQHHKSAKAEKDALVERLNCIQKKYSADITRKGVVLLQRILLLQLHTTFKHAFQIWCRFTINANAHAIRGKYLSRTTDILRKFNNFISGKSNLLLTLQYCSKMEISQTC